MLSQADLQVIQTVFGKTEEELSGALSSTEEVSLGLKLNGRVLSQDDEKELRNTLTNAGIEIGYKKLAKASGIELSSGEKDATIIADKLKTNIETKLEEKYKNRTPAEELIAEQQKVKEWEKKYDTLKTTYDEAAIEISEWESKYTQKEAEIKEKEVNNFILTTFPSKMEMDKDDARLIVRSKYDFTGEDGVIDKSTGNIVLDRVGNAEKPENVILSLVESKGWIKGAGMGGDDRNPDRNGLPKGMTDDAAMKYIQEAGKDPMSAEGTDMFVQLTSK